MRKAIYLRFVLIIFIAAVIFGIVSTVLYAIRDELETREGLTKYCYIAKKLYESGVDINEISKLIDNERITIISNDGTVIVDSEATALNMENHFNRPEIKNATEGIAAVDVRSSKTLGIYFMYAAIKLGDQNILRVATSYSGVWDGIGEAVPMALFSMLITLIIAVFLAGSFSKKIIAPFERLADDIANESFDALEENQAYYEISRITNRIKSLLDKMSNTQNQLIAEKDKISFILSNLEEGFILLSDSGKIQLINNSAKKIFESDFDFNDQSILFLTRNKKIEAAVEKAISGSYSSLFDVKISNKIYSVHVSPIPEKESGTTILLVDVTNERTLQEQRSSFFSNASHELKTPITSVLGFSEMLIYGTADDEKQVYSRIHTEAKRMNNLINDILTISRLESGSSEDVKEEILISDVVNEVKETLSPLAAKENIEIKTECDDSVIFANKRRVHELINNLTENAIKYNKENGKVKIFVKESPLSKIISVEDTGIGIPIHAQARVFERFYRVDSGRSKITGGTGLGLSIVKHIVLSLGGEIILESRISEGTKITIKIPK